MQSWHGWIVKRGLMKHELNLAVLPAIISVMSAFACWSADVALGQGSRSDYERALSFDKHTRDKVFRERVNPHWLSGNTSFWYRIQTGPGKQEYVFVDAVKGVRTSGFVPPPVKVLSSQNDIMA